MGGYPAIVPWDEGSNPSTYEDDDKNLYTKGLIAIEFNGSYRTTFDNKGNPTLTYHNNPDPIKIVDDPELQRDYFYLRQILYNWGREAGMQSLG